MQCWGTVLKMWRKKAFLISVNSFAWAEISYETLYVIQFVSRKTLVAEAKGFKWRVVGSTVTRSKHESWPLWPWVALDKIVWPLDYDSCCCNITSSIQKFLKVKSECHCKVGPHALIYYLLFTTWESRGPIKDIRTKRSL